jgi:hypothetical protein
MIDGVQPDQPPHIHRGEQRQGGIAGSNAITTIIDDNSRRPVPAGGWQTPWYSAASR